MRDDDGDMRPKRPTAHEIGSDLSALSVDEIAERIQLLEDEIARLEAEGRRKRASREAAGAVFR